MAAASYQILDRYELPCSFCDGKGCLTCRHGLVAVYVLVQHRGKWRCGVLGHDMVGHTERAESIDQLPRVAWCLRCGWQQVHTDVPEAYDVERQAS